MKIIKRKGIWLARMDLMVPVDTITSFDKKAKELRGENAKPSLTGLMTQTLIDKSKEFQDFKEP